MLFKSLHYFTIVLSSSSRKRTLWQNITIYYVDKTYCNIDVTIMTPSPKFTTLYLGNLLTLDLGL